jgi:asparagine synthase (glutamine-hydrolysing)
MPVMPGLCLTALRNSRNLEGTLGEMLGRMVHYPWHRPAFHSDIRTGTGIGTVRIDGSERQPFAFSADGSLTLALYGEYFNDVGWDDPFSSPDSTPAERLLERWRHEGSACLARLNGEYAVAVLDTTRRELHLATDRFGLRPLYVAQGVAGFAAASEIKSLLAVPGVDTALSEQGVAQFFSFGHFYGTDTFFNGVRAVPAATVGTYRLDEGTYVESKYWSPPSRTSPQSESELTAAFEARFVAAVHRRARPGERLGLSLSGGLDARTILGVAPKDINLQTISLGIEGSLDHQSAARLAALAGVRHHPYMLDASFLGQFETHLRQMVRLTDGHYLDQGIVMPTMEIYRRLGIDFLMRGHGGELLHMRKAYAFSLDGAALSASDAALESWLSSHLTSYMLAGVPDDLFKIDLRGGASAALRAAIGRVGPVSAPVDRVWHLFLNERLHRETSMSMHLFGSFATVRQPFMDNEVIDSLFAMPAHMKLGEDLQASLLRHQRPDFLPVTNSNTGAALGASRMTIELARLRLRVGAKLGLKGYQPYERLGLWLRRELRELVTRTLTGARTLDSFVVNN